MRAWLIRGAQKRATPVGLKLNQVAKFKNEQERRLRQRFVDIRNFIGVNTNLPEFSFNLS